MFSAGHVDFLSEYQGQNAEIKTCVRFFKIGKAESALVSVSVFVFVFVSLFVPVFVSISLCLTLVS